MSVENVIDDYVELRRSIFQYNNDPTVRKLKNIYCSKSFSEILGVSRREMSHSSFLAWLFDCKESHHLGEQPLMKLLALLPERVKGGCPNVLNSELLEMFCIGNYTISSEQVYTERSCGNFRADIVIEFLTVCDNKSKKIRLIIENKVSSTEHDDQTKGYHDYFGGLKDRYTNIYIYLTPLSSLKLSKIAEPECSCKKYIQINYQDIVDYIINPLINTGDMSQRIRFILEEYVTSLEQPALNEADDEEEMKRNRKTKNVDYIMAMSKEQRELLIKFWSENESLLRSAIEALSQDDSLDERQRESIQKINDGLKSFKKDFTRYEFEGEVLNKSNFVWKVVHKLSSRPGMTGTEIKKMFNWDNKALTQYDPAKATPPAWFPEKIVLADGEFMLRKNLWGKGFDVWESFYPRVKEIFEGIVEVK